MTIATLAHGARQSLARGLEALQAIDAPPALLDVAQPVARAMGVFVELERAPDGLVAARVEPALAALREGLRLLQLPEHLEHPAAARGMAAVAETLGVVVELALSIAAPPSAPARPAAPPSSRAEPVPLEPLAAALAPGRAEPAPVRAQVAASATRVEPRPPTVTGVAQSPPIASQPPAVPRSPAPEKRPEPKVVIARALSPEISGNEMVRDAGQRAIDAPLGTNSPSNFYTDLPDGDVLTAGGIFVATYQLPKLGETVLLEISLPGGCEFVAKAVVAWTRSAGEVATGSPSMRVSVGPPGFGARFIEIAEEGRRLVQRYVRNREPLFHDDP